MTLFCKHRWSMISEVTTKSKFENSMDAARSNGVGKINLPHQLCCSDRKIIQIVSCDKCGKLKRFITNI